MREFKTFDLPDDLAAALPNVVKDEAWQGGLRSLVVSLLPVPTLPALLLTPSTPCLALCHFRHNRVHCTLHVPA